MPRTITLTHDYAAPERAVWEVATDMDSYREVI